MIIFSRANESRNKEFRVLTLIHKINSKKTVERKALIDEAKPHIASLEETYKALNNQPNLGFKPPKFVSTTESSITFEFIEGPTLESLLTVALEKRDYDSALKILNQIVSVIEKWPSKKTNPTENREYQKVFGRAYNQETNCTNVGLIDLNLGNIIQTKSGLVNVDIEWYFDMPIPTNYLIGRMLYEAFSSQFLDLVNFSTTEEHPSIRVTKNCVVPKPIYEALAQYFSEIDQVFEAEKAFQKYVHSPSVDVSDLEIPAEHKPETITEPVADALRFLPLEHQLDHLKSSLEIERQARIATQEHLEKITNTFLYRALAKAKRLLRG